MINITGTEARRRHLVATIRRSMRYERSFEKKAVPILKKQAEMAAKMYRKTKKLRPTLAAAKALEPRWEKLYKSHYIKVGEDTGELFFGALKSERIWIETKSFDLFRVNFRSHVAIVGGKKIKQIEETTMNLIRRAVMDGRDEGEGFMDIAKRIYGNVAGIGNMTAKRRCRTIAKTETHTAYNYAAQLAGESTEVDMEKEWLAAEDDRTREDHSKADEQRVSLDGEFEVGGVKLRFPGDPDGPPEQIIECRCSLLQHVV